MAKSLDNLRVALESHVDDLARIAIESQYPGRFFHRYTELHLAWEQYAGAEIARPDDPNNPDKAFVTCLPFYLARRLAPPVLETVSRRLVEWHNIGYVPLPQITRRATFLARKWRLGGPFTIHFLLGRTLVNERGFRHLFTPIWSRADASWTDFYKTLLRVSQRRRGLDPGSITRVDTMHFSDGDAKMAMQQYKISLAISVVGPGSAEYAGDTHNKDDTQDEGEEESEEEDEAGRGGKGENVNEVAAEEGSLGTESGQTLTESPSPPLAQGDHGAEIGRVQSRTNNANLHVGPDVPDTHAAALTTPRAVGSYHGRDSLNDASRGHSTTFPLLAPASSIIAMDKASPTQAKSMAVASHHSTSPAQTFLVESTDKTSVNQALGEKTSTARTPDEAPSLSYFQRKEKAILMKLERDQVHIYMNNYVKRRHEHAGIVFWTSRDVLGQSGPDSLGDLRKFRNSQRVFSQEELNYDDFDAPPPTARWVAALFARDRNWTLFLARRNQHTESWNQAQVSAYGFDPDAPPDWRQPQEQSFTFRVAQNARISEGQEVCADEESVVIHARPPICHPLPSKPDMMPSKADHAGLACHLLRRFAANPEAFWQQGAEAMEACYEEPPARARRRLDTFAAQSAKAAEARTMLDTREQETFDALEALHNAEDRLMRLEKHAKPVGAATASEEILVKRKRRYLEDDVTVKCVKYTHASQLIDSAYASVQTLEFERGTFVSELIN